MRAPVLPCRRLEIEARNSASDRPPTWVAQQLDTHEHKQKIAKPKKK
jgi:hypothetical protein